MATSDRQISKPIVNVLTKAQYQGIANPSADEFYLITDDASVSAGTGISVNSAGGETLVSLDTGYAVTSADIITGTDTTNKLVSAKAIADAIEAGGGGGGGGSGTVTSVTAGAGLNTTSADTSTDGGSIVTSGTLYLTKSGVTANTYGSATQVPQLTVDKYGRVTSVTNTTITGVTPASHTHGDITNGGDITTTATIASGDRLVINDESASKITNSSITFGTSTSTYLRNDGTWGTPSGGGGGGSTYSGTSPISVDNTNYEISHEASGVTAGTYSGAYNNKVLGYYMPSVTVDDTGHVTSASNAGSLIVRARESSKSAYGSSYVGLMTYTEYNTLNSGIDFLFPHIFGDASNNDAAFTIAAGSSSKTVTVSYSTGNIDTSNFSHYQYPGKLIQSSSLSLCSVIGVVSYLVNTSTYAVEPVLVDWSATSSNSSGTASTGSSQTVTVTLADPVPTGYTLMFKILFSTQYFGH